MHLRLLNPGLAAVATLLVAACSGGGGDTGKEDATPAPAPIVSLSLSPLTVVAGQTAKIAWSAANATSCVASDSWSGDLAVSGEQTTSQGTAGNFDYALTCSGPSGSDSAKATLTVESKEVLASPTISISITPSSIPGGQPAGLVWSTTDTTACTANGAWSGAVATSGNLSVSQNLIGSYIYGLDCVGAGGSASSSAVLTITQVANSLPITLDGGPPALSHQAFRMLNVPYVSVTVCEPGTESCQTIDHVLLDTGSSGLRLISPGVLSTALKLPAVTDSSGNVLAECAVFASGFTWGSVRRADIKLAGEVALNATIQVIGDRPGGATGIPANCSGTGTNMSTVASLGANGILGVGLFINDCDACLVHAIPATYYACSASLCSGTSVTATQVVQNPVASFAQDNNGVVIILPAVGDAGSTNLAGSLLFGIGTQADNALGNATIYATNRSGYFSTSYKGKSIKSFIDSGSNALFFTDTTINQCTVSSDFYCPTVPLTLTATNTGADGGASGTVSFSVVNIDTLGTSVTAGNVGGSASFFGGQARFDWGLPFFFGRKVFTAINDANTPGGPGPYWAY